MGNKQAIPLFSRFLLKKLTKKRGLGFFVLERKIVESLELRVSWTSQASIALTFVPVM